MALTQLAIYLKEVNFDPYLVPDIKKNMNR